MAKIKQLSPHVADLIAAGEVVERPGSVIKELVENSIDAGAAMITVEIKDGGMTYMRVTDNGCGIAPEDTETAFLRHATSKLTDESGLEAINTLGFRGEALAAIASVSRIELMTCESGASEGAAVCLDGGKVTEKSPVGCPEGTTIIVRDLFFNTPARLKFMKTDRAEGANVSAVVLRCALSHPEVSIKYIKDGKVECHTPGDSRIDSCIYNLLGRDFSNSLLPAKASDDCVSVDGYVSAPFGARGNRSCQFFFVNGRFIKSKTLQAALEQAYKNSLFTGKFPACVLYITVRPNSVDVNVHPTKTEVKFMNERQVFNGVYFAALSALEAESKKPEIALSSYQESAESVSAPVKRVSTSPSGGFFKSMPSDKFRSAYSPAGRASVSSGDSRPVLKDDSRVLYNAQSEAVARALKPVDNSRGTPCEQDDKKGAFPESREYAVECASPIQQELTADTAEKSFRVIGEALGTYIVIEFGDSLWLVDKHAAHERIIFDRLKSGRSEIMSQPLLAPIIFDGGAEDTELLMENSELLDEFGFEVDRFGETSVAVRRIPSDIDDVDAEPFLCSLCEDIRSGGGGGADDTRDTMLHTMACKAAIKAGRRSQPEELYELARRVVSGEIRYCPHGRPVAVELTKSELDRHFKRT